MKKQTKVLLSAGTTLLMLWLLFSGYVTFIPVQWGVPIVLVMQFIILNQIYKEDR
ncbi:MAG: hypothetical protein ACI9F2_000571 [Lysobacterales bacterium]|jgi:hypothetical protein